MDAVVVIRVAAQHREEEILAQTHCSCKKWMGCHTELMIVHATEWPMCQCE